jgi:hypothetical protein
MRYRLITTITSQIVLSMILTACGGDLIAPASSENETVGLRAMRPELEEGVSWRIATAYRQTFLVSEGFARRPRLDPNTIDTAAEALVSQIPEDIRPRSSNGWTDIVVWEMTVLVSGMVPEAGSPLYEMSLTDDGVPQALTVVGASPPKEDNAGTFAESLEPTFGLVFRDDTLELIAVRYQYTTSHGRRIVELDPGSATDMIQVLVDVTLPDFDLDEAPVDMTVVSISNVEVEVAFTNRSDGGLVVQRWEEGRPWFTTSESDERISWLLE